MDTTLGQPESHHSLLNTNTNHVIPHHPPPNTKNPDLRDLPCGQLLSKFIDKCAGKGLLVMLDMHRLNELEIPELVRMRECACAYVSVWVGVDRERRGDYPIFTFLPPPFDKWT